MKHSKSGRRALLKLLLTEAFGEPVGRNAAQALGITENKVSRLVTGRDELSEDLISKLEKLLGVPRSVFLSKSLHEVLS
jgi:plasmid maintenance system antidote protein VapI